MKRLGSIFLLSFFPLMVSSQAPSGRKLKRLIKKAEKEMDMVYIPHGLYHLYYPQDQSDLPYNPDAHKYSPHVHVDSFFISKFELTNHEYRMYLKSISDSLDYKKALPDTLNWNYHIYFNKPYAHYYFSHPAYDNYPVVNISYNQVTSYCEWLTRKYNNKPDRLFEEVRFRLPTGLEWSYAALGGYELVKTPFPAEYQNTLMDENNEPLANICYISQTSSADDSLYVINEYTGDTLYLNKTIVRASYASTIEGRRNVLSPVNAYSPWGYGIYQMGGNVEEMILETGITKGGSWRDTGVNTRIDVYEVYEDADDTSPEMGVRLVMEVIEY